MLTTDQFKLLKDTVKDLKLKVDNLYNFFEHADTPSVFEKETWPGYKWEKVVSWRQLKFFMIAQPEGFRYNNKDTRERTIFWNGKHELMIGDDSGGSTLTEHEFESGCYVLIQTEKLKEIKENVR